MLPVLLDLKFVKIYTFGVFLMLGFLWASFALWRNIRLTPHKEDEIFDGLFISLFGGLFFGRLVYVLLNFKDFGLSFIKFILINGYPGMSVYGAIFGALITLLIFFSIKKINFWETIDYFMTPFFIAAVFGKLGGFFSGSEVGTVTKFFLKTKYFGFDGFRHLTPFYEALFFIVAALLAHRILFEIRKEKYFRGFLFLISMWYFSLINILFDKIKVNPLYFLDYSFNKVVSTALLLTISTYFIYYFRVGILSFIKGYGQKIAKKIRFGAKRKIGEGKK
ncbi:MAG: Prolipoprotein diacylglyceryl transferase [Candidatus Roizmanbacteria bacterium GW2011_GWC2_37_13]|uniref:Prolipoprotein diacylglyceryl transferase n=1 Tax=Candidatus Roizmanbacteria bacterium GW2011_GWC2_37_13 TaxID=1618486 RepID=A0A0G0ILZ6_9BACT|nr:MAG: Prolipoprotein diacylglyceryl transferase [Candidatus Roizmanbacteria bacterium GW2011_GWC1_37_12]KKQ25244.1 MAG: Prolipoprotein diacylglyceryl transferase [Candidatus Roizmanbacteria bacterium GW2011_GWC2_37_13]